MPVFLSVNRVHLLLKVKKLKIKLLKFLIILLRFSIKSITDSILITDKT